MLRFVFALSVLFQYAGSMEDVMVSEINGLSELPLEKLLQVQNILEQDTSSLNAESRSDGEDISVSLDTSEAQALHGKVKQPYQRGSYETSWQKKGGKKGLSTIFQISITALAFLAFGGYLLCLLMQAIRAKQTTATVNGMVMLNAPLRRRRPVISRLRRAAVWPETDPESLYYALKMFSEGFATYHTVDYKYYNFTADSLG
ncbi:hypothetical protein CBL_10686 [Carabus blaptoides fortunei]